MLYLQVQPKVAFQIDPFGHSAEFASLMVDMGMEYLIVNRIAQDDLIERKASKVGIAQNIFLFLFGGIIFFQIQSDFYK